MHSQHTGFCIAMYFVYDSLHQNQNNLKIPINCGFWGALTIHGLGFTASFAICCYYHAERKLHMQVNGLPSIIQRSEQIQQNVTPTIHYM